MPYYLKRGKQIKGPFEAEQLAKLLETKDINGSDFVATDKLGPFEELGKMWRSINVAAAPTPVPPSNPNLIACPDCNAEVSRKAQACPKCGSPIASQFNPISSTPTIHQSNDPGSDSAKENTPVKKITGTLKSVKQELAKDGLKVVSKRYWSNQAFRIRFAGVFLGLSIFAFLVAMNSDTTVNTGYGRVHNIGKMQSQQNSITLCGLAAAGFGAWFGFEIYQKKQNNQGPT